MATINLTSTNLSGFLETDFDQIKLLVDGEDTAKLSSVETGAEVNNINDTNATDLTDAGDSALHFHSTDRDRSNHTGTQTASTISDFDTEVSGNTDVAANTTHRSSNGTDHSFIDQDVTSGGSPEFSEVTAYNFTHKNTLQAGEAVVAGDLTYLKSDGKYWKVNAAALATSAGRLAIANSTISADSMGTFIVKGNITTTGLTIGATYFVSATAGGFTATAPSTTGQFVRAIGVATSTTNLEFIPSLDVYEVA